MIFYAFLFVISTLIFFGGIAVGFVGLVLWFSLSTVTIFGSSGVLAAMGLGTIIGFGGIDEQILEYEMYIKTTFGGFGEAINAWFYPIFAPIWYWVQGLPADFTTIYEDTISEWQGVFSNQS